MRDQQTREMFVMRERRRRNKGMTYSSKSSRYMCRQWWVFMKILSFDIDMDSGGMYIHPLK